MADHQLEPFENVELGEKQDQLQVFEKAVLEHEGRGTDEDSSSAPLPANYPSNNVCAVLFTKKKNRSCKSNY